MSNSFRYLKNSTASKNVNLEKIKNEVQQAFPDLNVITVVDSGEEFIVVFEHDFNSILDLNLIIQNHIHTSPQEQVRAIVQNAIQFGSNLIIDFSTENVLLGITQAGKTKEVADYLTDVMRYAQTGSLYEVINEIDRLIAAGVPVNLSPFITQARMESFKQKVVDYLS